MTEVLGVWTRIIGLHSGLHDCAGGRLPNELFVFPGLTSAFLITLEHSQMGRPLAFKRGPVQCSPF